jgi:hypothetical protein
MIVLNSLFRSPPKAEELQSKRHACGGKNAGDEGQPELLIQGLIEQRMQRPPGSHRHSSIAGSTSTAWGPKRRIEMLLEIPSSTSMISVANSPRSLAMPNWSGRMLPMPPLPVR